MPGCPRAPGVQLPSKSGMELPVPYKRCACNLTYYGLLRPVTANGDVRQFTDGNLVRLPADSVVFVGNGVWGGSHTNSDGATETEEHAASYDRWFRAKVRASLDYPLPNVPHDQVMADMRSLLEAKRNKRDAG